MFLVAVMHNKHLSIASCVMLQACDNRRAHCVGVSFIMQMNSFRLPSILIDDLFTPTQTHALKPRNCRRRPGAARATAARRIVCHAGQVQRRERIFRRWSTWSLEQLSTCGDVVWPTANDLNLCSTKQTMGSRAIVEHPLRFDHALVNSTADIAL